jgi:hypothetical protein
MRQADPLSTFKSTSEFCFFLIQLKILCAGHRPVDTPTVLGLKLKSIDNFKYLQKEFCDKKDTV